MADISQIVINGNTYNIKDAYARAHGLSFVLCYQPENTPYGVTCYPGGSESDAFVGELYASDADKSAIYLVQMEDSGSGNSVYDEYVSVETSSNTWVWERLGTTDIELANLVTNVVLNKGTGDYVLGEDTTFTNSTSSVTFSGGSSDTFVKSYPGVTAKLAQTSITEVANVDDITVNNITLGTSATAHNVTVGSSVEVAKKESSATSFYAFTNNISNIAYNVSVSNEVLSISVVSTSQKSIIGCQSTTASVPSSVSVSSVTVPQISSAEEVTVSSVTTNSVTVATGATASSGNGATVMTGLGNATTGTAVTGIGTGTAAAQTITVGSNDTIGVADYADLSITVTKKGD